MKHILTLILGFLLLAACSHHSESPAVLNAHLWAPDVHAALTDFTQRNAHQGHYVVFDFDNTTSIFDIEEQMRIYQLQTMSFAMDPQQLRQALSADLTAWDEANYADWLTDIDHAYTTLWDTYGPFTPQGVDSATIQQMQADPQWQEFATKMAQLYEVVCDHEDIDVAYCWILYWTTGMTPQELYTLARRSDAYYSQVPSASITWVSPADLPSRVGQVTCQWTAGVSVTTNLRELWNTLSSQGIDVWVCSASGVDQVKAAIDEFGLHDYCTGILAMTVSLDEQEKYLPQYEMEQSHIWRTLPHGEWQQEDLCTHARTGGKGKVTAIQNTLLPFYGEGPIAGFCDSSGDFNFCTEFSSLQLVVCFNRANRKVTEGGGLMALVALYERDQLGYDLAKALADGNTLYVLQGRDENGLRSLRQSNLTLRLDSTQERLYANEDNEHLLRHITQHKPTVAQIFNQFALATPADAPDNPLGIVYGWLTDYDGYHSK